MENKKQEKHTKKDIIMMIIILIIIILLLLHNCFFGGNGNKDKNGNDIDICDGDDCNTNPGGKDILINCLEDFENDACIVPNFIGKTEDDVNEWLNRIANNIDITFEVYDSSEKDGTVIKQSNEKNLTVKDLLENNIPLIIGFANERTKQVNCMVDIDNQKCVVPDFTGKTKNDVYNWLNKIANDIPTSFDEEKSDKTKGTIIKQSLEKGTRVKDIIDNNRELEISFAAGEKVDCLNNSDNPVCIVPNFTGSTQKEFEEWLDSVSNEIRVSFENKGSDVKSKTIIGQSIKPGTNIKQLIEDGTIFNITFATNATDDKVDCLKDVNNASCLLPNFVGSTKNEIENWLNRIANNIPIKYQTVESNTKTGIVLNQSIKSGTTVKDILDRGLPLIISTSKYKKATPEPIPVTPETEPTPEPEPSPEPTPDPDSDSIPEDEKGKVVVKDPNVVWDTETNINIFENTEAGTKIAPESSNTYRFSVNNNTDFNVKYKIKFTETNTYNINMKYKLRKNNSYIIDHYVSIGEINLDEYLLDSGKNDTYYLEWKWISSDNDMEIGTNSSANYGIKIEVEAEGLND